MPAANGRVVAPWAIALGVPNRPTAADDPEDPGEACFAFQVLWADVDGRTDKEESQGKKYTKGLKFVAARHPQPQHDFEGVIMEGFSGGPILTLPQMVTFLDEPLAESLHDPSSPNESASGGNLVQLNPFCSCF